MCQIRAGLNVVELQEVKSFPDGSTSGSSSRWLLVKDAFKPKCLRGGETEVEETEARENSQKRIYLHFSTFLFLCPPGLPFFPSVPLVQSKIGGK